MLTNQPLRFLYWVKDGDTIPSAVLIRFNIPGSNGYLQLVLQAPS
jgi:hypothetical protein